jgi:Glycosyl hydrolase catalytic core
VVVKEQETKMSNNHHPRRNIVPGKRGICYTMREQGKEGSWIENLPRIIGLNVYWYYQWGLSYQQHDEQRPPGVMFVPMLWGDYCQNNEEFLKYVNDTIPLQELYQNGTITHIFAFNEPDNQQQANLSVDVAIERWKALHHHFDIPLVSPSCVHADRIWMKEFMIRIQQYSLRLDGIGIHWYGPPNVIQFQNHIESVYQLYNKEYPLYITEFAVADWDATKISNNRYTCERVLEFMKIILPWLEQTKYVISYAWFPFEMNSPQGCISALYDHNNQFTKCGQYYKSITNENPHGDQTII